MKNLKTILLILAFGLIGNGVFAQSKAVKVDKKSINNTPQSKAEMPVSNKETQKSQIKTTQPASSVPTQSYSTPKTNSNSNTTKSTTTKQAQPIQSSGNNNSIPASYVPKSKGNTKSKK